MNMAWEKIENRTDKEFKDYKADFEKEHGFKYSRKPRYFVDENLGKGVTELLRDLGGNVTDAWEQGMLGYKDERIWRFARKKRRIILSHDDDFMDERKYPIRECYGYVVLPHKAGGEQALTQKLVQLHEVVSFGAGIIYMRKLIIRENGHWELYGLSSTGKIEKTLHNLNDRNHVLTLEN